MLKGEPLSQRQDVGERERERERGGGGGRGPGRLSPGQLEGVLGPGCGWTRNPLETP